MHSHFNVCCGAKAHDRHPFNDGIIASGSDDGKVRNYGAFAVAGLKEVRHSFGRFRRLFTLHRC